MDQIKDKCPRDEAGWTPLHSLAKRGHFDIYQDIISKLKNISNFYHKVAVANKTKGTLFQEHG